MQRRHPNPLSLKALTARLRAVTAQLLIAALVLPSPHAVAGGRKQDYPISYMMGLPGFRGMILTIAMVNKAICKALQA